jgi:hypothetical protein
MLILSVLKTLKGCDNKCYCLLPYLAENLLHAYTW